MKALLFFITLYSACATTQPTTEIESQTASFHPHALTPTTFWDKMAHSFPTYLESLNAALPTYPKSFMDILQQKGLYFLCNFHIFHPAWFADFTPALSHILGFFHQDPPEIQWHKALIVICQIYENLTTFAQEKQQNPQRTQILFNPKPPSKAELLTFLSHQDPYLEEELKLAHKLPYVHLRIIYNSEAILPPHLVLAADLHNTLLIPFPDNIANLTNFHSTSYPHPCAYLFYFCVNNVCARSSYLTALKSVHNFINDYRIRAIIMDMINLKEDSGIRLLTHAILATKKSAPINHSSIENLIQSITSHDQGSFPEDVITHYKSLTPQPQLLECLLPRTSSAIASNTRRWTRHSLPTIPWHKFRYWTECPSADDFSTEYLKDFIILFAEKALTGRATSERKEAGLAYLRATLQHTSSPPPIKFIISVELDFSLPLRQCENDQIHFYCRIPLPTTMSKISEHDQFLFLEQLLDLWCHAFPESPKFSLNAYSAEEFLKTAAKKTTSEPLLRRLLLHEQH